MKTVNLHELPEEERKSPKGKYHSFCKNVSVALGAPDHIGGAGEPHPFDLQIRRLPPGKAVCPYHSHTTQWELLLVMSGSATVRCNGETHTVRSGDAFVHRPGTAHQITNASATDDLVLYIVADNPPMDFCHYPDSNKFGTRPLAKWFRMREVDYFDGEE
jgi:uncharacterized cupin superfamily protein